MTAKTAPRRGRTRWILVTAVAGLTLLVLGVVWLESLAPEVEVSDLVVQEVPLPAIEEERSCTRRDDDTVAEDLRSEFAGGGRVTSTQVYLCPAAFDGLAVVYAGEVVGELLPRRGGVWAQVNDDAYALEVGPLVGHRQRAGFNTGMSVWIPDGLHEQIEAVGRPGVRGDVILVGGTLLRADPDDGGGTTIRAEAVEILAPSVVVEDPLHVVQLVVAVVLALTAVAALAWSRQVRRR